MCRIFGLCNAAAGKFSIDMIRRWISHFQWKICWANIVLQSPESIKLEIEEKFLFNGSTTFAGRMHSSKSRIYSTRSKLFKKEEMLINSISTICGGNFPKQTNSFNGFLIFRKVRWNPAQWESLNPHFTFFGSKVWAPGKCFS